MSIHLLECAAVTDLAPSTKLALMAFADSADRYTHIALPGLDQVMRWSGVGRSRAAEIVAELTAAGLLHKHRGGHRGRRAEYVVFPYGCCPEHPRDLDVQDAAEQAENTEIGSGGPDSLSVNGSAVPDPIHPAYTKASGGPDPLSRKGSGKGPVGRTPSLTTTTNPPFPPAQPGGDQTSGCQKPGPLPHVNCRGCGTTTRQLQRQRRIDDEQRRRDAAAAEATAERAARETTRVATEERPPELVEAMRVAVTSSREQFHLAKAGKR